MAEHFKPGDPVTVDAYVVSSEHGQAKLALRGSGLSVMARHVDMRHTDARSGDQVRREQTDALVAILLNDPDPLATLATKCAAALRERNTPSDNAIADRLQADYLDVVGIDWPGLAATVKITQEMFDRAKAAYRYGWHDTPQYPEVPAAYQALPATSMPFSDPDATDLRPWIPDRLKYRLHEPASMYCQPERAFQITEASIAATERKEQEEAQSATLAVPAPTPAVCPDCKGTREYVGLLYTREPCRACCG